VHPIGSTGLGEQAPLSASKFIRRKANVIVPSYPYTSFATCVDLYCVDLLLGMVCLFCFLKSGDHDILVKDVEKVVLNTIDVVAVSEVQLYYKDSGMIDVKVDVVLSPKLTIQQAHAIAGE
jgi:hypothetical protein